MYDNNTRITIIFRDFSFILARFLVKFEYPELLATNALSIEMNYLIYFNMLDNFVVLGFYKIKKICLIAHKICNNYL